MSSLLNKLNSILFKNISNSRQIINIQKEDVILKIKKQINENCVENEKTQEKYNKNKDQKSLTDDNNNTNSIYNCNYVIIANINSVYSLLNPNNAYFYTISNIYNLIFCLNIILICVFILSFKMPVNNLYCWSNYSQEFIPCKSEDLCISKISKIKSRIVNIDSKLMSKVYNIHEFSSRNPLLENLKINNYFKTLFIKDHMVFNKSNTYKSYKDPNFFELYGMHFFISYKENINLANALSSVCEPGVFFFVYVILYAVSLFVFNFILSILSDGFGRKKGILLCCILQCLGIIVCFIFFVNIENKPISYIENNTLLFNTNKELLIDIVKNKKSYNKKLNQIYNAFKYIGDFEYKIKSNLSTESQIQESIKLSIINYIKEIFDLNLILHSQISTLLLVNKFKIFLILGYLLISISSYVIPISYAYVLEHCLSDKMCNKAHLKFYIALPIGLFTGYFLIYASYLYIVYGTLLIMYILVIVCILFYHHESPRFLFERKDYYKFTHTIFNIFKKEHAKINNKTIKTISKTKNSITKKPTIISDKDQKDSNRIKYSRNLKDKINSDSNIDYNELRFKENFKSLIINTSKPSNKNNELNIGGIVYKQNVLKEVINSIFLLASIKKLKELEFYINKFKYYYVFSYEYLIYPFLLHTLLIKSKYNKRKNITIALLQIVSNLTFYLVIFNFFNSDMISREDLHTSIAVNHIVFYYPCVIFISFISFHYLSECIDYKTLISCCNVCLIIFSAISAFRNISLPTYNDLNIHYFGNLDINNIVKKTTIFKQLLVFFSSGQLYLINFITFKHTKTVYRCTYLCLNHYIGQIVLIIAFIFWYFFDSNIFLVTICNVIGLILTFFLNDCYYSNIVTDFLKIE